MRKVLYLFLILTFACNNDDDDGCKCQGEFVLFSDTDSSFFVNGVDCETGEPTVNTQAQSGNDVFYIGCTN